VGEAYPCPLCGEVSVFFIQLPARPVYECPRCELRFVPKPWQVTPEQERARYELHRNSLQDEGYVRFLRPVIDGLERHLQSGCEGESRLSPARILDYGSGPTPVLVELLHREGFKAVAYDPYFAPEPDLSKPFDAVIATETFEHFRQPRLEIDRIVSLLRHGGLLVVMTALCLPGRDFRTWHYANDETHIAFYSEGTFRFVESTWGLRILETNGKDLIVAARAGS
jgi:hypothetical protein